MEHLSFGKIVLLVVAGLVALTVIASCAVGVAVVNSQNPVPQQQFEQED